MFEHQEDATRRKQGVYLKFSRRLCDSEAAACELDDQFLFGRDILVAPVTERAKTRRPVYLPPGRWYPFAGGKPLSGGLWTAEMPLGSVPAFIRAGAIIPCVAPMESTSEYHERDITFHVYGDRASGVFIDDDGASIAYRTGSYNAWDLSYADGRFQAVPRHLGYDGRKAKFYFSAGGERLPVELRG